MSEGQIVLENITKQFGSTVAVQPINFEIKAHLIQEISEYWIGSADVEATVNFGLPKKNSRVKKEK